MSGKRAAAISRSASADLATDPLHVGLAGGEPDLADEDIADHDHVGAGDGELGGHGRGGRGLEVNDPAAVCAGGGADLLAQKIDGHAFTGGGLAPDGQGFVALEDGVVLKERREGDLGAGERGGEEKDEED
jgi:hypothetical protein